MSSGAALTALSILSLCAGAILPRWLSGAFGPALLDGLVLGSVTSLVLLLVIPESVHHAGPVALLAALLGVVLPYLLERVGPRGGAAGHVTLGAALLALLVHTALDGVGLATADRPGGSGAALAVAIVAHRFPVGLALWLVAAPRYGRRGAAFVLALVSLTTVVGFWLGDGLLPSTETPGLAIFQAFVAGSLLHVLLHTPEAPASGRWRPAEVLGAGLGFAGVLLLPDAHTHPSGGVEDFGARLLALAAASAPALVVGHGLAGVAGVFLPRISTSALHEGGRVSLASRGIGLGWSRPLEASTPLARFTELHQVGTPSAASVAWLLGAPLLAIEALLLSLPFFGVEFSLLRLAAAGLVTLTAAVLVGVLCPAPVRANAQLDRAGRSREESPAPSWKEAAHLGFIALPKETAPWLLLGFGVAASIEAGAWAPWMAALPEGADVGLFALLGLVVHVSAAGATPIAAAFVAAGTSSGAALAFLLAGPALHPAALHFLRREWGSRLAVTLAAVVLLLSALAGLGANTLSSGPPPPLGTFGADARPYTLGSWIGLGLLVLIFGRVLLELGPRGFLNAVLRPAAPDHEH